VTENRQRIKNILGKEIEMKKIAILALGIILLAATGYCADPAQAPQAAQTQAPKEFGGIVANAASLSAVVAAIDPATRAITLKTEDGKEDTFIAGPEVRNFAQIQKGDKVNIDYVETVKVIVSGTPSTPQREDNVEVARAPLGAKPGGVITASSQILATVEAIDYQKRTATLKGPQRTIEVQVGPEAVNFDKVKVGDSVYLELVAKMAVSVTK
jgi:hypothetical protein